MKPEGLLKLLDLVRRELGADDARAELGGRPPSDPTLLWCELEEDWRIVAIFDSAPSERDALLERLRTLARAFSDLGGKSRSEAPTPGEPMIRRLDRELEALAIRIRAVHVLVIDDRSPMIWGTSEPRRENLSVDDRLDLAALARRLEEDGLSPEEVLSADSVQLRSALSSVKLSTHSEVVREIERYRDSDLGAERWRSELLVARAVRIVRQHTKNETTSSGHLRLAIHDEHFGLFSRPLASIYHLIAVFDGQFSELHAEGAMVHASPVIERLVLSLPPVDPPPGRARVVRLRRS